MERINRQRSPRGSVTVRKTTLIQTGMRPEERLWLKMEMCSF